MDESLFESNKLKLIEAITTTMGPGSGPENSTDTEPEEVQHASDTTSDQTPKVGGWASTVDHDIVDYPAHV